jgi:hypothetical protein
MVVLGAAAGDEGMTIGNVNSQAGVFRPGLRHRPRSISAEGAGSIQGWVLTLSMSMIFSWRLMRPAWKYWLQEEW